MAQIAGNIGYISKIRSAAVDVFRVPSAVHGVNQRFLYCIDIIIAFNDVNQVSF